MGPHRGKLDDATMIVSVKNSKDDRCLLGQSLKNTNGNNRTATIARHMTCVLQAVKARSGPRQMQMNGITNGMAMAIGDQSTGGIGGVCAPCRWAGGAQLTLMSEVVFVETSSSSGGVVDAACAKDGCWRSVSKRVATAARWPKGPIPSRRVQ